MLLAWYMDFIANNNTGKDISMHKTLLYKEFGENFELGTFHEERYSFLISLAVNEDFKQSY